MYLKPFIQTEYTDAKCTKPKLDESGFAPIKVGRIFGDKDRYTLYYLQKKTYVSMFDYKWINTCFSTGTTPATKPKPATKPEPELEPKP